MHSSENWQENQKIDTFCQVSRKHINLHLTVVDQINLNK